MEVIILIVSSRRLPSKAAPKHLFVDSAGAISVSHFLECPMAVHCLPEIERAFLFLKSRSVEEKPVQVGPTILVESTAPVSGYETVT